MDVEKGKTYSVSFTAVAACNVFNIDSVNGGIFPINDRFDLDIKEIKPPKPDFKVGDIIRHRLGSEYTVVPGSRGLALVGRSNGVYYDNVNPNDYKNNYTLVSID